MKQLQISKIDAALRQLQTAILLYFNARDPVSIHTLTAASYNIIRDLRDFRSESFSMFKDALNIREHYKKEFRDLLNESENFFKHADRDPNKNHLFRTDSTELLLIDACDAYIRLMGEIPDLVSIFKRWHLIQHPQYYREDAHAYQIAIQGNQVYSDSDRFLFFQDCFQSKLKI